MTLHALRKTVMRRRDWWLWHSSALVQRKAELMHRLLQGRKSKELSLLLALFLFLIKAI